MAEQARTKVDDVYRSESRRVFATLIRLLGDFDLAEEALHDAFRAALEQWPRDGVPANPRAWLVSAGRFKAIDAMRRRARFDASLADDSPSDSRPDTDDHRGADDESVEDDRLRLIFTCCHPALPPDAAGGADAARGLRPDDRGDRARLPHRRRPRWPSASCAPRRRSATRAFLIRCRRAAELPDRLDTVLRVVYLVFNEGYSASSGESLTRPDLSGEAIRLGRLLRRAAAGTGGDGAAGADAAAGVAARRAHLADGRLVLLEDQDRSLWNREQIAEGAALVERALASRQFGPYTLQAAIAAVHAEAPTPPRRTGRRSSALYDVLARAEPSPVVELNRAVAVAMRDGPSAGLALIDAILARGDLGGLPPGPRGAGGPLPAAGPGSGSPRLLRARPRPDAAGAGAALLQRRLAELG